MTTAEFHIKNFWRRNSIKKIKRTLPSSYDEFTAADFLKLFQLKNLNLLPIALTVSFIHHLLSLRPRIFFNLKQYELDELAETLKWMVPGKDPITGTDIPPIMEKFPLQKIRCGWRNYYGPADRLSNITVIEWVMADSLYMSYASEPDTETLHRFLAVLYRPANPFTRIARRLNGRDVRIKLNEHFLEKRAARLAKLPLYVKQSIMFVFEANRHRVTQEFNEIFKQVDKKYGDDDFDYAAFIYDMAGPELGTVGQVEAELVNNVFHFCQRNQKKLRDPNKENLLNMKL